jgi:hypothetical protein
VGGLKMLIDQDAAAVHGSLRQRRPGFLPAVHHLTNPTGNEQESTLTCYAGCTPKNILNSNGFTANRDLQRLLVCKVRAHLQQDCVNV